MTKTTRVRSWALAGLAAVLVAAVAFVVPSNAGAHGRDTADSRLPKGFTEQKVRVGDVGINYVRGGRGPVLVLLHGYPETWFEWHEIMPALAAKYTVIAPDLRGAGKSDAPAGGYDKKTMAADVHGLLTKLGLNRDIRLVGHDIGTMVAYAYAAAHPAEVKKLVLSEAPIPDENLYSFPALSADGPGPWQFGFFLLTNGLPEQSVDGREEQWVQGFTDHLEVVKDGVGPEDVKVFAKYLKDDAHLRASFEWFRAFPADIKDNAVNKETKLPMPVLAIGADHSLKSFIETQAKEYATNVTGAVIANSGHWIYEEHPEEMTERLLSFLAQDKQ
ncbi:pimeloyl-ACP methyl ester carboxylesterase [Actinoplanes lutulentus]|uniref:Pimeloyl-ACP methyl ester carboxylesterase n=1 Tax=Actinoplanes lutulentus TaxID=1287878 RepID=A0A327ZLS3_9ACTN|nr:alpha/beta hydrolase [Actinoplanes lutulentus]MBB2940705.1 pimeloyl-ACP methyl ester carboxylesterase [Actinoplanes lutulentus]RAK43016.1 pimeloyl-ACP methyl ester carboxylesterase [Actinoplanes lutulentus]